MRKIINLRTGVIAVSAAVLVSMGAAAMADEIGTDEVEVNVDIAEIEEPGVLALSVAADSTTLTENGSTDLVRQFTGTLPAVTVTDTRDGDDVPADAAWAVIASASSFVGSSGQAAIPASNLGWTPALVAYTGDGEVFAGEPVEGTVDGGSGLVDQELLFSTIGSALTTGSFTANASLALRTTADVAPGQYSSTITLSLFE